MLDVQPKFCSTFGTRKLTPSFTAGSVISDSTDVRAVEQKPLDPTVSLDHFLYYSELWRTGRKTAKVAPDLFGYDTTCVVSATSEIEDVPTTFSYTMSHPDGNQMNSPSGPWFRLVDQYEDVVAATTVPDQKIITAICVGHPEKRSGHWFKIERTLFTIGILSDPLDWLSRGEWPRFELLDRACDVCVLS